VDIFRKIAERKIEEAIERGELDDLPLAGTPITPDPPGVPEELRLAYRLLRNANVLPEELQLKKRMHELKEELSRPGLTAERRAALVRELNAKESQLGFLLERLRAP
jgi:hypothetical protein